mgnify:CR=1 FL=1
MALILFLGLMSWLRVSSYWFLEEFDKVRINNAKRRDNKNRTASNIRTIFQKSGGNLGTQGSASHNFNQLGIIKIDKKDVSSQKMILFEFIDSIKSGTRLPILGSNKKFVKARIRILFSSAILRYIIIHLNLKYLNKVSYLFST